MGKQIFNGCCFCFDLRSGGQILGWLYLVCGVVGALGSLLIIAFITQIEDMEFYIGENEVSKAYMITVMAVTCAVCLISACAGLLLVIGIKQQSHRKMILFMVVQVINMIAWSVNIALDVITIISIIALILGLCLDIYFLLVIYSLYIKTKNQNQQVQTTHYPYPNPPYNTQNY